MSPKMSHNIKIKIQFSTGVTLSNFKQNANVITRKRWLQQNIDVIAKITEGKL